MPTANKRAVLTPNTSESLDEWAAKIAALEPDVARGVIEYAQDIAENRRVAKADREFAQAQAKAVKGAMAKAKRLKRK